MQWSVTLPFEFDLDPHLLSLTAQHKLNAAKTGQMAEHGEAMQRLQMQVDAARAETKRLGLVRRLEIFHQQYTNRLLSGDKEHVDVRELFPEFSDR